MDNNGTLKASLAFILTKGTPSVSPDVCKARLRKQLDELAPPSDGVDEYLRKIAAGTEAVLATMVAAGALGCGTLRGKLIGVVAWIVAAAVSTFISGRPGIVLTLYLPGGWLKFHGGHYNSVFYLMLELHVSASPLAGFLKWALNKLGLPMQENYNAKRGRSKLFAACAALCVFSLDPEWVPRLCANFRHSVHNPHGLGKGDSLIDDALLTRHAKLIAGDNYDLILSDPVLQREAAAQAKLARERHGKVSKKGAHTRNVYDEERNSLAPKVEATGGRFYVRAGNGRDLLASFATFDDAVKLIGKCTSRVVDVYARVAAKRVDAVLALNGVYADAEAFVKFGAPKLCATSFLTLLFAFGLETYGLWARDAPMLLAATRWSFYPEGRNALACMQAAIRVSLAHGVRGDFTLLTRFRAIEIARRASDKIFLARWCIALKAEVAKLDESMRSTRVPGVSARASRDVRLVYCRYLDKVDALVERCRREFAGDFEAEKAGRVALVAGDDDGDGDDDGVGDDFDDFDDDDIAGATVLEAALASATDVALRDVGVISVCAAGQRVLHVDLARVPGDLDAVSTLICEALPALLGLDGAATIDVSTSCARRRTRSDRHVTRATVVCTLPENVYARDAVNALMRLGTDADATYVEARALAPPTARPVLDLPDEATLRKALARALKELGAGGTPATSAQKSRLRSLRKIAGLTPLPKLALPRRQLPRRQLPRSQLTVSDSLNYVVREGGAVVVGPRGDRGRGWGSRFATAGTKCAVVDKVTLDCGTTQCKITRPFEGWVNLTDLVPLEGDDDSSDESSDDEVMDFSGAAALRSY